jgi:spore coat protein H
VIEFAQFLSTANDSEFSAKLSSFLDLDEFARYMAVNVWLVNSDSILSMGHNFYVYLDPKTNRFQFFPWDLDLAFDHFPMGQGGTNLSVLHPWQGQNRFLERVFNVDAFRKIYLTRMSELTQSVLTPQRISRQVDELATVIRPAVRDESETKFAQFEKSAAGEVVSEPLGGDRGPGRGGRGGPGGRGTPIKAFLEPRATSVADQLKGNPGTQGSGAGRGGPGMDGMAGPLLGSALVAAMDTDHNGSVSRHEFSAAFSKWFEAWGGKSSGALTLEQIRIGLDRDLPLPEGMPGFGPPPAR